MTLARLRTAAHSARLHAMRATFFENAMRAREDEIGLIRRSTSWRLTLPLRLCVMLLREGPVQAGRRAARFLRRVVRRLRNPPARISVSGFEAQARGVFATPALRPAQAVVAPRVLIIAEISLPQCAKYRVWQRQEYLQRLGFACTVIRWQHKAACRSALQTHALVIFYRVPALPDAIPLFAEARRLGVTSYWEVDDLIFDMPAYLRNRNLDLIDPALRAEVLSGVELFRAGLLACDRAIASTPALAAAMRAAGRDDALVIENALDDETLRLAEQIRLGRKPGSAGRVVVGYGSGSKAHNADFLEAAAALATLMHTRPEIDLHIMGDLTLPAEIEGLGDRVRTFPAGTYPAYLEWLATCDIAVAPLEGTAFNEAKSNIKYIEASCLGVPCICSPRQAFADAIANGQNGFLASTTDEWLAALESLAASEALRLAVGEAARQNVLARYAPEKMQAQVAPLVRDLDQRAAGNMRVLVVNVFYWPQSYGGATIVTQELARHLQLMPGTDVFVFTSHTLVDAEPYTLVRYADPANGKDMPVFAVRLPENYEDPILGFDNPQMLRCFEDVLAACAPTIVHFHCVQSISSSVLDACSDRGLPFVITVHDAWWICERQFMVTGEGRYCAQRKIDLHVCQACIPTAEHLRERWDMSLQRLSGAARLLFPSAFHRDLHLANGIEPQRAIVSRNGVRWPARPRRPREAGMLRFGYVGGNDPVKGIHLIRQAFENLGRTDYRLILTDNTTNMGFSSMRTDGWKLHGELRIVPAYRQETMDDFFESIDVLLFPSQWKESFGLTVREALIRDVWVIATDGGGTVEDILDGVNGTILPFSATAVDLRNAVAAVLERPDRLAGHVNPHKDRVTTYEAQAGELHAILGEVSKEGLLF